MTRAAVVERLSRAGCVAPDDEADELLATAPDRDTLGAWVARREQGEPLAWITGTIRFAGVTVAVDPGVYVPRHQTEELARRAAGLLRAGQTAADLCTGCGAVAAYLRASVPEASVVAVDLDPRAARCARRNRVPTVRGDLGHPLRPGRFDLVTAVPPYVPSGEMRFLPADVQRYEPLTALDGGDRGVSVLRRVVGSAAHLLRPGGHLLVELGGDQDRVVAADLAAAGFVEPVPWDDEEGDRRGLTVTRR